MPTIIALTGRKGSGKTSLARILSKSHDYWIIPLANPIKVMVEALLKYQGCPQETAQRMLRGDLKEEPTFYFAGKSPRYVMQTLGTEWRNLISENLWLDIWENAIYRSQKVVVDDLRFPHEAERMKKLGGKVIRIARPGIESDNSHPSESAIDQLPVDLELTNDSSIFNLADQLASQIEL